MKRELKIFDNPKNVQRFLYFFYFALLVLLVVDLFIPKHGHFPWENAPEFFAVYGFISCVSLIFIAKLLRKIVKRREDYYDK
jgi:branched-subunit amino acid transport protein